MIEEIESENFDMRNLKKLQRTLQEYLSLLLKWDWERSKKEVKCEITSVIQYGLWIFSIMLYTIALFSEYKSQADYNKIYLTCIMSCITLVVIIVFLIVYIEKQTKETCMITLVGHVLDKQKKTSEKKYGIVLGGNLAFTFVASVIYVKFLFEIVKYFEIHLSDMASVIVLVAGFGGCGAIIANQVYMSEYAGQYYNYAHAIDLIRAELTQEKVPEVPESNKEQCH